MSTAYYKSLDEVKDSVVTGPAEVLIITAYNPAAAVTYIQLFDKLTADVTVGSTTPDLVIGILNATGREIALHHIFKIGIVWAATTTPGGNSAPSANLETTLIRT